MVASDQESYTKSTFSLHILSDQESYPTSTSSLHIHTGTLTDTVTFRGYLSVRTNEEMTGVGVRSPVSSYGHQDQLLGDRSALPGIIQGSHSLGAGGKEWVNVFD